MTTICALAFALAALAISSQTAAPPCAGLPPGKHAVLERMTAEFGLTCDQELRVEVLLHDEESVSKPLLAFAAFSPEEKGAVMLKVKLAARRQIRPLLTPDQQKKMDAEIEAVAKSGSAPPKGNAKVGSKSAETHVSPFDSEESLSQAIIDYTALSPEEKPKLVLQVKQAARRATAPALTSDQQAKIDRDIRQLANKHE